jgi:hypothetical protein
MVKAAAKFRLVRFNSIGLNFKSGARSVGFGTLRLITQYSKSIDLSEMLHDSVGQASLNPKGPIAPVW